MSLAQFNDNLGHIGVDLPKGTLKVSLHVSWTVHVCMYTCCISVYRELMKISRGHRYNGLCKSVVLDKNRSVHCLFLSFFCSDDDQSVPGNITCISTCTCTCTHVYITCT